MLTFFVSCRFFQLGTATYIVLHSTRPYRPRYSSTRRHAVYWFVKYKNNPHNSETTTANCQITCDSNTTFDQLLQSVKEATHLDQIKGFICTEGVHRYLFIHNDRTMMLAMENYENEVFDNWKVGIMVCAVKNGPPNQISEVLLIIGGIGMLVLYYNLGLYIYDRLRTDFLLSLQ